MFLISCCMKGKMNAVLPGFLVYFVSLFDQKKLLLQVGAVKLQVCWKTSPSLLKCVLVAASCAVHSVVKLKSKNVLNTLKNQFCAAFQVQEVWLVAFYWWLSHRCEMTRVILWGKIWITSLFMKVTCGIIFDAKDRFLARTEALNFDSNLNRTNCK